MNHNCIIVGRAGDQAQIIDGAISPIACKILVIDDNKALIQLCSSTPVYCNERRLTFATDGSTLTDTCSLTDKIEIGNYKGTVDQLAKRMDATLFRDFGDLLPRLTDIKTAQIFVEYTTQQQPEHSSYLTALGQCCEAWYHLQSSSRYSAIQKLLYAAGDTLYAAQDGSDRLKSAYAGVLSLLACLYGQVGMESARDEALAGSKHLLSEDVSHSRKLKEFLNSF